MKASQKTKTRENLHKLVVNPKRNMKNSSNLDHNGNLHQVIALRLTKSHYLLNF